MPTLRTLVLPALLLVSSPLLGQQRPTYPEGAPVPRSMTPAEAAWVAQNPLGGRLALATPPPSGDVHCAAEYEPMDGIFIAWEGSSSWTTILSKMAAEITTIGDANVYCVVDSSNEANSASTKIASYGANMARVEFLVDTTDSIWMRDYGPRYIYQGDVRAIVDHTYNRPRPQDNLFPTFAASYFGHTRYEHALSHGGGNFHLDALGGGYLTRLINNENPSYSEGEIAQIFKDYQNLDITLFTPFPTSVDSTQHLDMWMQVYDDDKVMISDWPAQSGSTQDDICDDAALEMAAKGFTVTRVPARTNFGTHYTYTNVVMCNDLVLIPMYTNGTIQQYNSQALAAWQAALPGKTIVQIDAQSIVTAAGVLHCIVMHQPAHRGGVNPTAYLSNPNGGEILHPGDQIDVSWLSDDDVAATGAALELSTDGGSTWSNVATGLSATGTHTWTVPSVRVPDARMRVTVNDASANTGSDDSNIPFAIATPSEASFITYGEGKPGTLGVPQLTLNANPILGSNISLQISDALPNSTAKLLRGGAKATTPFDGAIALVAYDRILDVSIDANGDGTLTATLPSSSGLIGRQFFWQCWIPNDPAATGLGWSCSAGLLTQLGL